MDGFLRYPNLPGLRPALKPFAMGYKNASDIPLYWKLPTATCSKTTCSSHRSHGACRPTCTWSRHGAPNATPRTPGAAALPEISGPAWPVRMDGHHLPARPPHVSWGYYITPGWSPDCPFRTTASCADVRRDHRRSGIRCPVQHRPPADHQLGDIRTTGSSSAAAAADSSGRSWVIPNSVTSEHPPGDHRRGAALGGASDRRRMHSPDWKSSAIFISWDDWAGSTTTSFAEGRRPGIRPARARTARQPLRRNGYVDHQVLTSTHI